MSAPTRAAVERATPRVLLGAGVAAWVLLLVGVAAPHVLPGERPYAPAAAVIDVCEVNR